MSFPSTQISPKVGFSSRLMERSSVDLPLPEGPIMEIISPCSTFRLTPRSTCRLPKSLYRPLTSITCVHLLFQHLAQERQPQHQHIIKYGNGKEGLKGAICPGLNALAHAQNIHQPDGSDQGGVFQQADKLIHQAGQHALDGLRQDNILHHARIMHSQRHGRLILAAINGIDAALEAFRNISGGIHGEDQRAGLERCEAHRQYQRNAEIHHEHLHQHGHAPEHRSIEKRKPLQGLDVRDFAQRQGNGQQKPQNQRTHGGFQRNQQCAAEGGEPVQNDAKIQLHDGPVLPVIKINGGKWAKSEGRDIPSDEMLWGSVQPVLDQLIQLTRILQGLDALVKDSGQLAALGEGHAVFIGPGALQREVFQHGIAIRIQHGGGQLLGAVNAGQARSHVIGGLGNGRAHGGLTLIGLKGGAGDAFDQHLIIGALGAADDLVLQIIIGTDFGVHLDDAAYAGGAVHIREIHDLLPLLGGGHAGDHHVHAVGLQRTHQRGKAHGHDFKFKAQHVGQFLDNVNVQAFIAGGIGFGNRFKEHKIGAQGNRQFLASKGLGLLGQRGAAAQQHHQCENPCNNLLHRELPPSFDAFIIIHIFLLVNGFYKYLFIRNK